MNTAYRLLVAGVVCLTITAPGIPQSYAQDSSPQDIDGFLDRYVKDIARFSPEMSTSTQILPPEEQEKLDAELSPLNEARRDERFRRTRSALSELRKFDRSRMTPVQRVTAAAMEWDLDNTLRSEPYRDYGYVFNQFSGMQSGIVGFLSNAHPIRNEKDVRNYLSRLRQVAARFDEGIGLARTLEKKGVVPPREVLVATIEQIKRFLATDPSTNVLTTSLKEKLEKLSSLTAEARADFLRTTEEVVKESIYPAHQRVLALLQSQLPNATGEAGWSRFPDGEKAYAQRLRSMTTTSLTASDIHELGLKEVARIEKEIDRVLRRMGFTEGTYQERLAAAERKLPTLEGPDAAKKAIAEYEAIIRDAYRRSDSLFDLMPKAKVEVSRVPQFREANVAAFYTAPAPDGSRPGVFWVPLPGPSVQVRRTLAYHEAVPGHHFQIAIQREQRQMPAVRTLGLLSSPAFSEGWGLYVERLAWEEGWYKDDPQGELVYLTSSDLFRAKRLVVDTGIHSRNWTISRGVDYGIRRGEVERYAVNPGQATSYKVGELRILAIREKARRQLGSKFSLREFHNVVLRTGNVPFEVLESVLDEYVSSAK